MKKYLLTLLIFGGLQYAIQGTGSFGHWKSA